MDSEMKRGGNFAVDRSVFHLLWNVLAAFELRCEEFESDFFVFRPYNEKILAGWDQDGSANLVEDYRPNLEIKMGDFEGFTVAWYKHMFRGAYCNRQMNEEDIRRLSWDIVDSLIDEINGISVER